jgi:metal-responsive CopG/Arc/MetJ family transcriptional regulator
MSQQSKPELHSTGVQLPKGWIDTLDELAEENETSRSAVIRAAIDMGLRARKYDDAFELVPENHERDTVADLAKQGELQSHIK